jgi:hypothetical protein
MFLALRVEWSKAWSRTNRWTEEVRLLKEEMHRSPIWLRHKASWWRDRCSPEGFEGKHAEGVAAYAHRQAALYSKLADHFEEMWAGMQDLEEVAVEPEASEDGDEEERDDDDADDGVDAEGPEEGAEEEEEEGSVGGEDSAGEEEE